MRPLWTHFEFVYTFSAGQRYYSVCKWDCVIVFFFIFPLLFFCFCFPPFDSGNPHVHFIFFWAEDFVHFFIHFSLYSIHFSIYVFCFSFIFRLNWVEEVAHWNIISFWIVCANVWILVWPIYARLNIVLLLIYLSVPLFSMKGGVCLCDCRKIYIYCGPHFNNL